MQEYRFRRWLVSGRLWFWIWVSWRSCFQPSSFRIWYRLSSLRVWLCCECLLYKIALCLPWSYSVRWTWQICSGIQSCRSPGSVSEITFRFLKNLFSTPTFKLWMSFIAVYLKRPGSILTFACVTSLQSFKFGRFTWRISIKVTSMQMQK